MTDKARELIQEARRETRDGRPRWGNLVRSLADALEKALNENVALRARLDTRRGKT